MTEKKKKTGYRTAQKKMLTIVSLIVSKPQNCGNKPVFNNQEHHIETFFSMVLSS